VSRISRLLASSTNALREGAQPPEPVAVPVENPPEKDVNAEIRKDVNTEIRISANTQLRKDVNTDMRKYVNAEIRKKPVRNSRVNLKIQDKSWKKLNRLAHRNEMFLADVLEQLIENADLRISANTHDTYKEHDDHDDDRNHDEDHLHRIRKHFQKLTGKMWQPNRDRPAYDQIKHLSVEQVLHLMDTVFNRAKTSIGTFSYFVTGIVDELNSELPSQGRAQLKKQYQQIINQMQAVRVGSHEAEPISEFVAELKDRCAERGISWHDDIANEILGL